MIQRFFSAILCVLTLQQLQGARFLSVRRITAVSAVCCVGSAGLYALQYPEDFRSHLRALKPWWLLKLQDRPTSAAKRLEINALLDQHHVDISLMFGQELTSNDREHQAHGRSVDGHEGVVEFPWLSGYLIKRDVSRILGAQALMAYIEHNQLKHVTVAEKWLYRPKKGSPLVVVKKLEQEGGHQIDYWQAKDICAVLRNVRCFGWHYQDFSGGNLGRDKLGRLVFIDTETKSFGPRGPEESLMHLLRAAKDDRTAQYIEEQLAQTQPLAHSQYTLWPRFNLYLGIAQKLGLSKDQAMSEIKKHLQPYMALYDEQSKEKCETKMAEYMALIAYTPATTPPVGTQKELIDQLLNSRYINPNQALDYLNRINSDARTS